MSVPQVGVYLLSSEAGSSRTNKVSSLFSSPLFSVNVMEIKPPSKLDTDTSLSENDQIDNYRILWCLRDSKTRFPDNYVLIVKDNSVSDASPERIANVISGTIKSAKDDNWHVFYLGKWLDRCDLYTDKKPINGTMTTIAKAVSPKGFQAIVLSPEGRDIIIGDANLPNPPGVQSDVVQKFMDAGKPLDKPIGEKIHNAVLNGQLKALAAVPSLIRYDVTSAQNLSDYERVNECEIPPGTGSASAESAVSKQLQEVLGSGSGSGAAIFWFIIFIILIIVLILLLLKQYGKVNFF